MDVKDKRSAFVAFSLPHRFFLVAVKAEKQPASHKYVDGTGVKILSAAWLVLGIPSLLESRMGSE